MGDKRRKKLKDRVNRKREIELQRATQSTSPKMINATKLQMRVLIARRKFRSMKGHLENLENNEKKLRQKLSVKKHDFSTKNFQKIKIKRDALTDQYDEKVAKHSL